MNEKTENPHVNAEIESNDSGRRIKVGVAMSGGGARGFAHAGALMAIEEAGLKPDIVAGVSAGSVIAVLYASGMNPKDIPLLFYNAGFSDFAKFKLGKGGLFSPDKFKKFIVKNIGKKYKNLEDLPIETYLGVTDLTNGVPAEFHTGEIGPRMIASCSIPIIFKPVEIDGAYYVDGGVLRNHPAWIIRDKCDLLIGINVSPLHPGTEIDPTSLMDVAMRAYNLMLKANQNDDMQMCDVSVITPELAHYKVFDLKNITPVFVSGYIHTRRALKDAGLWKTNPTLDTIKNLKSLSI